MTKFYFTTDNGEGHIAENADIEFVIAEHFALAKPLIIAELQKSYPDTKVVDITEGMFGDCWIKAYNPDVNLFECFTTFTAEELNVSIPGTHPGGPYTWISPSPEIYVAVLEIE